MRFPNATGKRFCFPFEYLRFSAERLRVDGGYLRNEAYGGRQCIETIPIKCEYAYPRTLKGLFDLALIDQDPKRLHRFHQAIWNKGGYELHPTIPHLDAFEFPLRH